MDRVTRHLVFQLPQASHRPDSSDGHQTGSLAELRADSDDDVFGSTQHSTQRVENGYGWKRRSQSPSYFLEGGKDVWTPSPDRESKLEVVKSGSLYDLRAYRGERKPSKLYDEEEQDVYRVPPPNISPEKARELEDERREVIRSQVMRKSSTIAERWSSMDELSSINTGMGSQGEGRHAGSVTTSFAISFDKPSPGRAATPVDPDNIDTEQINFSAARQQFLMLEKSSPGSFFSPGQQAISPKPESVTKVSREEWHSPEMATKAVRGYGSAGPSSQSRRDKSVYQVYNVSYKTPEKEEVSTPRKAHIERSYPIVKMSSLTKALSREDLDSGLGEMYNEANTGYGSDGSASNETFSGLVDLRAGSNGLGKETKVSSETPIEREIRMAMEREENLWKERGIQRLTSSSELVEIQTKPVLALHGSPGPGRKGKDRGRASLYVQREIEQETKREEDLKRQGRLLGAYDRGTHQELDERRRVFEQEEAPPQKSMAPRQAEERRSWVKEFVVEQPSGPSPTEDTRDRRSSPSYTASIAHFQLSQPRFTASERSREKPSVSQHASASASKWGSKDSWGGKLPGSTPSPTGTAVLPREYFSLSFWKPKVSFAEDMGTQSPLRREDGREEQYRLRTWKPQTSALIEEEIRSDLQREEELQEQRRRLMNNYRDSVPQEGSRSRHSSAASGASGSYSVSGSPVSTPASHQTGILGLMSSFTPLRMASSSQGSTETPTPDSSRSSPCEERRRRVKEDGKYAGIEPIDKVNTEVVESTRVIRHKSAMAQRWEAGQYVRDED
ncbi:PREDICTED: mitotic interactor and substrate of PLK1 isoform X1 [Lepidothrix coronata]|uniref:Mitotic interactor and substrate of PLK1 isoform X1 n=1 Tax=Lepidothrix coronata TaxID=321398 RepID=A0A6J0IV47_9PASS|nr:PREDICTED: mitotic interactor and substrate of PLK1 isoform X1 [Lepidothrix coronata]XP_017689841.1 PREDICTED: mitotic interactor and substrate of PLK1 isoform X1 [Lepidothrix coronata]XP_017689842.1 PREDICTED: mitotic interactor and substrate of PLK1 isoform X1 [Lepidothrix coronata]XP_017689843.1 PREDICTED: mitotic interactor and substrate of PLK1 isoform X1 [Lepidothrix coronata]XP_017689844.1 PREDICTED: mitotic interactor and substrate of PLK1 isoform X1 [Lepidothrix coronata]